MICFPTPSFRPNAGPVHGILEVVVSNVRAGNRGAEVKQVKFPDSRVSRARVDLCDALDQLALDHTAASSDSILPKPGRFHRPALF